MTSLYVDKNIVGSLFSDMKASVAHFFDMMDMQEVQRCVEKISECQGTVFLTGVGKSGIIAKKIAMTMNSCGTKSAYLCPLDALHGDLGQVSSSDCVLLLSKSGQTDELLDLCPALRHKGAVLIAVVSNNDGKLARICDHKVYLPVSKELCPYNLAPTTSTLVQLMFGDLVAITLMQMRQFTSTDFAKNHPAGRIGKRLTIRVSDLMLQGDGLPVVQAHDTLGAVLVELSNKKCGCVLIANAQKQLLGIFTDGDLRRALQKHGAHVLEKTMAELMTSHPRTISSDVLAFDAMQQMESDCTRPVTVLAVVDDGKDGGKLVGLIRMHDIVQSGI